MKKSFFVVALSLFIAACGSSSTPEGVAEEFFTELYNGKADTSKFYLGEDGKDPATRELFEGKIKAGALEAKAKADKKGGLDSVKIVSVETEGNHSRIKLELTFKDGSKDEQGASLYNDNGTWKLQP